MVSLSRPYPFNFFKGSRPQILLDPFLNTLSQFIPFSGSARYSRKNIIVVLRYGQMSGMVEPISGVIGALIVEVSFVVFNYQFYSLLYFFYLLFGYTTANFGRLLRRQPHSPNVKHCILSIFDRKVTGSLVTRLDC